jgi:TonB family protein
VATTVEAEYSPEARVAVLQGTVVLSLEVTPAGAVRQVRVRRGLGLGLDEMAVAAAKQWRYQPFDGDRPLMTVAEIPFQLEPPGPWRVVGSKFSFPPAAVQGRWVKPVLQGYRGPESQACTKDLVYVPVDLTVGEDGKPGEVRVSAAIDANIATAAVEAVQSWLFQPGTAGGTPEASEGTILLECRASGATTVADGAVFRIGAGVSAPSIIFKFDPDYTEAARKAKLNGTVILSLIVDAEGRPQNVRIVKSLGMGLDEEAVVAVTQWRFKPSMKAGQPVSVRATIEVNFRAL